MHKVMTQKWRRALGLSLVLILLLAWTVPSNARPACNTYSNSGVTIQNGVVFCGYTGSGCTECVTLGAGPAGAITCWSNGWSTICGDPISGYFLL